MKELAEAELLPGGLVRERWVADQPMMFEPVEDGWQVREWSDALLDLHYIELKRPYRGPVEIFFPDYEPRFIRVLAWAIQNDKVSQCIQDGAAAYASMTARWPRTAWIHALPKGADYGVEVDGVILIDISWALPGYVFLGG